MSVRSFGSQVHHIMGRLPHKRLSRGERLETRAHACVSNGDYGRLAGQAPFGTRAEPGARPLPLRGVLSRYR